MGARSAPSESSDISLPDNALRNDPPGDSVAAADKLHSEGFQAKGAHRMGGRRAGMANDVRKKAGSWPGEIPAHFLCGNNEKIYRDGFPNNFENFDPFSWGGGGGRPLPHSERHPLAWHGWRGQGCLVSRHGIAGGHLEHARGGRIGNPRASGGRIGLAVR